MANSDCSDEAAGSGLSVAEDRDQAADERDQAADERDQAGDERDQAADERDQAGDQRDQAGDQRDQAGDQRDQAGDQRDQAGDQREASASAGITTDALNRLALARQEAASDRLRASQHRGAGATERTYAELGRNTALADRGAGASERTHAELGRNTALADRGASARERDEQARLDVVARSEQSRRLESLGELAVGVAHDFNNLLGVILNYTTLVAKPGSTGTRSGEGLSGLQGAGLAEGVLV